MLDFSNSLFVGLFLDVFVFSVTGEEGLSVYGAWGLNTPTSKKAHLKCLPKNPIAMASSLAPSSVIAEVPERAEPLQWLAVPLQWLAIRLVLRTHCDRLETSDSLQGLWLHCVILCGNHPLHMIVHTPQRSLCHKHMWWGCAMVASHTREQWRLWRHFCEGWSRIPPEEGMKHLSLVLSPLHVEESLRLFSVWCRCLCIVMISLVGILLGVDLCFGQSIEYSWLWLRMRSLNGAEVLMEARSFEVESLVGLTMPSPLSLTGKARILRPVSPGAALFVFE